MALWNYEHSKDPRPGGAGSLTLADITSATLTVTDNRTAASGSFNPLTGASDDTGYGSTTGTFTRVGEHWSEVSTD